MQSTLKNKPLDSCNVIKQILAVIVTSILTNNDMGALSIAINELTENDFATPLSPENTYEDHTQYIDHF